MDTIWFRRVRCIRNGLITYEIEYYSDYECKNFICKDPYREKRRDHEVVLQGTKYYALRKIDDL